MRRLRSILYSIGTTIPIVALGRILSGLGCSVAYLSGIFIAVKYLPSKRLPIFVGLLEAVSVLVVLLGMHIFKKTLFNYGWFYANLGIIVFCSILFVLFVAYSKSIEHTSVAGKSFGNAIKQTANLMTNTTMLAIFTYSFCTWLIFMSFAGYWIKSYMLHMHGYIEADVKPFIGLYWSVFLVSNIVIGFFISSLKRIKLVFPILAAVGFIDFIYIANATSLNNLSFAITLILAGISASGVVIAFTIIPKFVDAKSSGTALAINNTFIVLGGYVGQILFGQIVSQDYLPWTNIFITSHNNVHYYSAFLIYPFFAFIGLIMTLLIAKKLNKKNLSPI